MVRQRILSVLRWALYSMLFLVCLLLQTITPAGRGVSFLPLSCVPVAVSCIAMHEGAEKGGLFALLASLVWCLSGASYGSVQIVTLTLAGVVSGGLCQVVLTRRFFPAVLLSAGALAFNEGVCFLLRLYLGGADYGQLVTVLLPMLGWSILLVPPVYLLSWLIAKIG